MAGLAYLIVLIPGVGFILQIVLFAVEKNRFTKFHAAQAMILSIVGYVLGLRQLYRFCDLHRWIERRFNVDLVPEWGRRIALQLRVRPSRAGDSSVFGIWGMISGFTGKTTKLPVIGDFAESLSGGPVP